MDKVNRVLKVVRRMSPRKREQGPLEDLEQLESPETCEESLCSLGRCLCGKRSPDKLYSPTQLHSVQEGPRALPAGSSSTRVLGSHLSDLHTLWYLLGPPALVC